MYVDLHFAVRCRELEAPENGDIMFSESPVGSGDIATFTCDDGFELDGSESITCGCNGEWSDESPTCEEGEYYKNVTLFTNT